MENTIVLNKAVFTLADVFGATFNSSSQSESLFGVSKNVFVTGSGLRRVRYFERYNGRFFHDLYADFLIRYT